MYIYNIQNILLKCCVLMRFSYPRTLPRIHTLTFSSRKKILHCNVYYQVSIKHPSGYNYIFSLRVFRILYAYIHSLRVYIHICSTHANNLKAALLRKNCKPIKNADAYIYSTLFSGYIFSNVSVCICV